MSTAVHNLLTVLTIFFVFPPHTTSTSTWKCVDNKCVKEETKNLQDAISIKECKVTCLEYGGLWPRPTGSFHLGNHSSRINVWAITFESEKYSRAIDSLLSSAQDNFFARIRDFDGTVNPFERDFLFKLKIHLKIHDPSIHTFSTGTDESYNLQIFLPSYSDSIRALIEANNFFGLRHGLETLHQLIYYDEVHKVHKIIDEAFINDSPQFEHRGIALDTARSFISPENILKLLNVMAANKLNTFHWHITDSQSFPYVSSTYPELSEFGAYSKNEVYTQNDIKIIVDGARSLGIRVLPEFDGPAHVGEGWPALGPDLITCFKWQPWRDYCVEPPCGQLDPTNERVYEILGNIFKEFVHLFESDLFHLGGDEVNINCWRSTPRIKEWMKKMNYSEADAGYQRLWGEYQVKALKKLKEAKPDSPPKAVLWTSTLTEPDHIDKYADPKDYVIQIWTLKTDPTIKFLIQKNFSVIFSNYDELYFDCGGPSWVGRSRQNWCSPYIGWQFVYNHSPFEILEKQGIEVNEETKKLVLGSEATIWTEQIDDHNLHVRLWPRAAALAERLWSNPKEDWTEAQYRMNHHRERLAKIVPTELLQPQWCYQNDGFCN